MAIVPPSRESVSSRGKAHALYRFFDAAGNLLYIGITLDPGARFKTHRDEKPWWHQVARIEMEGHPTRASALDAERSAIQAERPKHNVQHNNGTSSTPRRRGLGRAAPAFDCADCDRRIGKRTRHIVLHDGRVVCTRHERHYRDAGDVRKGFCTRAGAAALLGLWGNLLPPEVAKIERALANPNHWGPVL